MVKWSSFDDQLQSDEFAAEYEEWAAQLPSILEEILAANSNLA